MVLMVVVVVVLTMLSHGEDADCGIVTADKYSLHECLCSCIM